MTLARPTAPAPRCPSCRASGAIRTHEQLGEQLFFCPACEHTWAVRPGETPTVKKPRD